VCDCEVVCELLHGNDCIFQSQATTHQVATKGISSEEDNASDSSDMQHHIWTTYGTERHFPFSAKRGLNIQLEYLSECKQLKKDAGAQRMTVS